MAGIHFKETMDGYIGKNFKVFRYGEDDGISHGNKIKLDVEIEIASVDDFIGVSQHQAKLSGKFYCKSLGGEEAMTIEEGGRFHLFDIGSQTGHRNMKYYFTFNAPDGTQYYFSGFKDIFNDKGLDMTKDMTTLFVRIYKGSDETGSLYGSGIMHFRLKALAHVTKMIWSFKVTGTRNPLKKIATLAKFAGFVSAETLNTYTPRWLRFVYRTNYENLVLSGNLKKEGGEDTVREFFFFSGEHEKGFPWGDEEAMSDVALLISDGQNGFLRFGITKQSLKGLNVRLNANSYTYEGELYRINNGHAVSFSEIENYNAGGNIQKVAVEIKLTLDVQKYKKVDVTLKPIENLTEAIPDKIEYEVKKYLQTFPLLGYFTTPHRVKVTQGTIKITDSREETTYSIVPESTFGEGELGEIHNLREPTMYYNYLCGIDPGTQTLFLKIDTGTLRNEREWYLKDLIDKALGKVYKRDMKKNLLLNGGAIKENPSEPTVVRDNLLTLVNDHYSTAVLLRRIVKVQNNGQTFYGLEEYIDPINKAPIPIDSDKEATVAVSTYEDAGKWDGNIPDEKKVENVYKSPEKFDVLDKVIEETNFFKVLDDAQVNSGKSKEDFSIIIKPNFMFAYSSKDKSTYTDPALVEHLVEMIYEKGFRNIKIAEARCTLSVFFQNRDVRSVARYLGYQEGGKYQIIDLSDNLEDWDYGGKLGKHKVNKDWKSADFRISFAKNKTHSYAYYTLTIKNIYGALPMEYKYKKYHHEMGDIYKPTIDYINYKEKGFRIHFGFIDAVVSADGPFGIFADPYPQLTMTIIGGEDIVAVDWVGASKMGLDPMISRYMQEGVKAFGKPRIRVKGNGQLYKLWANTPWLASFVSTRILDPNYTFGYLVYYLMSGMDTKAFPVEPSKSAFLNKLRRKLKPARDIIYKSPHKPPSWLHKYVNKVILKMWE